MNPAGTVETVSEPAVRTVSVPFRADRGGTWPVTFSQGNVFDWFAWEGSGAVFGLHADLPGGCTVDDLAECLGVLVSRHEGLRTVYRTEPADARQQIVHDAGRIDLTVVELGAAARDWDRTRGPFRQFDHARDYPLRLVVATDHGRPVRALFECSHVAFDLAAAGLVVDEFQALLVSPGRREVGARRWQPVDQAEYEATPQAARHVARTLDYWRRQLIDLPVCLLTVPARAPGPAQFRLATLRSTPLSTSLHQVSRRSGVSPATVLVSAIAGLLSWWTGSGPVPVDVIFSNRSLPNMDRYVGTIAQAAFVPFRRDETFYGTLRRTHTNLFEAYRYAYFDATAIANLVTEMGVLRGAPRHRDLVVNDMSTTGGNAFSGGPDARGEAPETVVQSGLPTTTTDPVRLTVLRVEPTVVLGLTHDACHVTDTEAAALLHGIDRLLGAAAHHDVDMSALGDLVDLRPVRRDAGWARVGSAWIDVASSERRFRQAVGDERARVLLRQRGDGTTALVGCASVADPAAALNEVHARCLGALGGGHGVIAPDEYVLCPAPPSTRDDLAAWHGSPGVVAGSGR
ncbi:condensation domain-containing protein [Jidongwangia harbinensis]|uniref:condensation domain-containing protein n=1 Tax=Jidongwangia harbinensis TaxID=2878561 RepID=UPI001CD9AA1F|nr:condensation domain-containing protein [Jidongwangia harbinensis]MCA2211702.1 condensation domain-containing protein [Jidongwangia harbinensis]